ncbi:hypothetical protein WJ438_17060 [Streptomyces sp. GD-15H]|uniref:hypothetical protein n=1 Tax=Streptomyces sp. GD-15H TaxID=3129112 RepID=UPI00324AB14F
MAVTALATSLGCTNTSPKTTSPTPSASSSSASPAELTAPEQRPGHHRLAAGGPRSGDWNLGSVRFPEGISWVNADCVADTGTGKLTLAIDTVGEFTVDCPSTEVRINVNQLDLVEGRKGRFRVETSDNVRWTADIQVPD